MIRTKQSAQGLLEMAIVMPGVFLAVIILVGIGVVLRADGGAAAVASEAARAAALQKDAPTATAAARSTAMSVGDGYGLSNGSLKLATVDTSDLRRGGEVRVLVTYALPLGELPLLGWQSITLQHEAFAPIDPNRTFR